MKIHILTLSLLALAIFASDLPTVNVEDFEQGWFTNYVNHYNYLDRRTYQQRYWVNDKFWDQESGPVFLYICGEYACSVPSTRLYPFMVGAENNALLMVIEHRYYGESQPLEDWTVESLRYLSAEQALSDIANFIHTFNAGTERKWVVIGGSYPGALSAWFRERYPHLAVASWSSSGVVEPIIDFYQFDGQIYTSTLKSGEFCPTAIQNLVAYVSDNMEKAAAGGDATIADSILSIFDAEGMRYDDFQFFFADIFVISVQYGGRTDLCDLMASIMDLSEEEQLEQISLHADSVDVSPTDYCSTELSNTTIDFAKPMRQWTYQYCTQYGFFQVPDHDHPMRSNMLVLPFWNSYCLRIFPGFRQTLADRVSAEFGGFNYKGTNTFFVNGSEDPWRWAGMSTSNEDLSQVARVVECNNCGHCLELYTPEDDDPQTLKDVREEIRVWLGDLLNPSQTA